MSRVISPHPTQPTYPTLPLQYLASHHPFLERCRLLLAAGAEPHLSFEDQERLSRHGFRDWLLTDGGWVGWAVVWAGGGG